MELSRLFYASRAHTVEAERLPLLIVTVALETQAREEGYCGLTPAVPTWENGDRFSPRGLTPAVLTSLRTARVTV